MGGIRTRQAEDVRSAREVPLSESTIDPQHTTPKSHVLGAVSMILTLAGVMTWLATHTL